jgi:hypothetical protein
MWNSNRRQHPKVDAHVAVSASSDRTSTFDMFPNEILELILLQADDSILPKTRRSEGKYLKSYARALCLVCLRWKSVVYECDRFWETQLDLALHALQPGTDLTSHLNPYRTHLENSGGSDIRLAIVGFDMNADGQNGMEEVVAEHFSMLRPRSSQIKSITFACVSRTLGAILSSIFKSFGDLRRLQSVKFFEAVPLTFGAPPFDFSDAVCMTELVMRLCNLVDCVVLPPHVQSLAVIQSIKRVDVAGPIQWGRFHCALRTCQTLSSIELHALNLTFPNTSESEILDLPQLGTLTIFNGFQSDVQILRRLHAPNLTSLVISLLNPTNQVGYASCLAQFGKLRTLEVHVEDWDDVVENFLNQTMPGSMELFSVGFEDGIRFHTPTPTADRQICPTARTLQFKFCEGPNSWLEIFDRFQFAHIEELVLFSDDHSVPPRVHLIPLVGGQRIVLSSVAKLRLVNFHSEVASVFCNDLDAPSVTTLVHEMDFYYHNPFPRPCTRAGFALRKPPSWYSTVTKLELPFFLETHIKYPEHPLSLFASVEDMSLKLIVGPRWSSDLTENLLSVLWHRRPAVPKLRHLSILLYPRLHFEIVENMQQTAERGCQVAIEKVILHRRKFGSPLQSANLAIRRQVYDPEYITHSPTTVMLWSYDSQSM